jgi:hypothetical protein
MARRPDIAAVTKCVVSLRAMGSLNVMDGKCIVGYFEFGESKRTSGNGLGVLGLVCFNLHFNFLSD